MNLESAWRDAAVAEAFVESSLVADELSFLKTWAFCLMTSAGVRIVHEIASAMAEAVACIRGVGS